MSDEYNDGYTHEAAHTMHVLQDTFYNHVFDTRCADKFPAVKAAAEAVLDAMAALYGTICEQYEPEEESSGEG